MIDSIPAPVRTVIAALVSRGIALFEYLLRCPATGSATGLA
jgi:uncharacterized protein (DUF486 family)